MFALIVHEMHLRKSATERVSTRTSIVNPITTVQEGLQADAALVGKKAMLVYDSAWSRAVFSDKAQTRANGLPRPVLVLRGPHVRRQDNLLAIEVRCALAPPNDDRNGVRSLLLHRITEFHEVDKITAAKPRMRGSQ